MKTLSQISFALFLLLGITACAAHHKPPVQVWRFEHCAQNAGHIVCECEHMHDQRNGKSGDVVRVCD